MTLLSLTLAKLLLLPVLVSHVDIRYVAYVCIGIRCMQVDRQRPFGLRTITITVTIGHNRSRTATDGVIMIEGIGCICIPVFYGHLG